RGGEVLDDQGAVEAGRGLLERDRAVPGLAARVDQQHRAVAALQPDPALQSARQPLGERAVRRQFDCWFWFWFWFWFRLGDGFRRRRLRGRGLVGCRGV